MTVTSVWPTAAPIVPANRSMKKPSKSMFAAPSREKAMMLSPPVKSTTRRAACFPAPGTSA